ncbi:hypothetical protein K504DRAFT_462316 [Pleomassaria siparia CBS 279.74]|uniref:F-box domain-containing protein n=1 Tax=Pleomassaria siparia CBS 279.74 TaxID=1314801 RepID=A0A6G1KM00_9PLEO|nr:hypothetical protein K504DRAFT_462316 [Pleomassaria siparia CBS 279.74]
MARTMAPAEYQEVGRRYYKQKQYEKAIEAFTNGIEAATSPSLSLFDHRAASYDKLAKYSSAVKDGREMIKMDKQNVKGYLRTGSVLEKMNKLETAAGIYKYGMKNVPVTDSNFKILQLLHDKIIRKLSPAKAVDPFTVLPSELVEIIIGHVSFQAMVNCMRVNKGWRNWLKSRPNLWTDLDFSGARKPVSKAFIREAVFRSQYRITRVTVHRVMDLQIFVNVATACKGLTELEFMSGGLTSKAFIDIAQCAANLKKLVIHNDITLDTATQILRWRPTLEHVEFRSILGTQTAVEWKGPFPNLRRLLIKDNNAMAGNGFNLARTLLLLTLQTPGLESLTVQNYFISHDVELFRLPLMHLVLDDVFLLGPEIFPRLPSTLKELTIRPSKPILVPTSLQPTGSLASQATWANAVSSHLPHLVRLSLSSMSGLNAPWLSALLDLKDPPDETPASEPVEMETLPPPPLSLSSSSSSPLQHISIKDSSFGLNDPSLFGQGGLMSSSPRILSRALQSLDISTLYCSDDDIEALLTHPVHNLQIVDLSRTRITGASVKMLVDGLPDLKYLNLNECTRISGRDAIHYAEKKGVTVSCQMSERLPGGKRVRYG